MPDHPDLPQSANSNGQRRHIAYCVTGRAAHQRWKPLLPADWVDVSPYSQAEANSTLTTPPDFLWENAPRRVTTEWRDSGLVYSHLPNGSALLDSKWVLARLMQAASDGNNRDQSSFSPHLATLETHGFRGRQGWTPLAQKLGLLADDAMDTVVPPYSADDFADLASPNTTPPQSPLSSPNWWVIKDAASNGAGGIWMVGAHNATDFGEDNPQSPLIEGHLYVAQRYVWPGVLYRGRKAHVRVYAVITADLKAYVHRRGFLHIANEPFLPSLCTQTFDDSVHLTNCCANSHDADKFAGEICARLWGCAEPCSTTEEVDLSAFGPSILASVAALAHQASPFLAGGRANGGLEYLGLDFILSYKRANNTSQPQPIAYLLEVNAPPSQDTATGLPHAEAVHNAVLQDLLTLWILPRVCPDVASVAGGWQCVYAPEEEEDNDGNNNKQLAVLPSQAAVRNRLRWALYEHKMRQVEARTDTTSVSTLSLANRVRLQFAYFRSDNPRIFWENGGGTQVPATVVKHMQLALENRHRLRIGTQWKQKARRAMSLLLGASIGRFQVGFGANATQLLARLARAYLPRLDVGDEIVLSTENHWANVQPWLELAEGAGAAIIWWKPGCDEQASLARVVSDKTRIVALTHVSNVLGVVRNLTDQVSLIRQHAPHAFVVVDGVAAVPHIFANVEATGVDWYVISCHKFFGPHLGVVCGRTSAVKSLLDEPVSAEVPTGREIEHVFESGTMNYEACAGISGMLEYWVTLASTGDDENVTSGEIDGKIIQTAYNQIAISEQHLTKALVDGLGRCPKVHLLPTAVEVQNMEENYCRVPVVSFSHENLHPSTLVDLLSKQRIDCRHGTFLSSPQFLRHQSPVFAQGFVRLSLVHYNTVAEVQAFLQYCEGSIPGWFGSDAVEMQG